MHQWSDINNKDEERSHTSPQTRSPPPRTCARCRPGRPRAAGASSPWRRGTWSRGCRASRCAGCGPPSLPVRLRRGRAPRTPSGRKVQKVRAAAATASRAALRPHLRPPRHPHHLHPPPPHLHPPLRGSVHVTLLQYCSGGSTEYYRVLQYCINNKPVLCCLDYSSSSCFTLCGVSTLKHYIEHFCFCIFYLLQMVQLFIFDNVQKYICFRAEYLPQTSKER